MKKILSIFLACTFAVSGAGIAVHARENNCAISDALKSVVGQYVESKLESWTPPSGSCGILDFLGKFADTDCFMDFIKQNVSEDTGNQQIPGQTPEDTPVQNPESVPEIPDDEKEEQNTNATMSEAEKVVALVNKYRSQNGLPEVSVDEKLSLAATKRAQEQEILFSHTRPDGSSCFTVLSEYGVSYRGAGENIAMGQRDADEVMTAWMNSDGHRANILGQNFTKIGVGVHKGADGRLYWAQMFLY